MEQSRIAKQVIEFQRAGFDNTFTAMTMLQDQTERMVNMFLEQATWLPDQGKKALNEWVQSCKKGREQFKKTVDESYKKVEDFFAVRKRASPNSVGPEVSFLRRSHSALDSEVEGATYPI